jgi:putative sterol carrier protein
MRSAANSDFELVRNRVQNERHDLVFAGRMIITVRAFRDYRIVSHPASPLAQIRAIMGRSNPFVYTRGGDHLGRVRALDLTFTSTREGADQPGARAQMNKSEMAAALNERSAWLPGKRVKLDFGDEGVILLDGAGERVSEEDGAADTTIKVAWADWEAMRDGKLDGMTAFMQGKLKVEGDMSNAMQLQGVLAKLR